MIKGIVERVAGLDVHKDTVVGTVLLENPGGDPLKETRSFGTMSQKLKELASWLTQQGVELAVMESTGIYWKPVFEALEEVGLKVFLVNARHVRNVPGRKTDVKDSEWLAELARCGLLRPSFVPPKDLRELRSVSRYREKMSGMLASEKNRLQKILDECGIRLSSVVSDINGVSARKMIQALINGMPITEIPELAVGSLRGKKEELLSALEGTLSERHRFLLRQIESHIRFLSDELAQIDTLLIEGMAPYRQEWQRLQTIPGLDQIGAALLLVEIGTDMERFGSAARLSAWAGMCPGNNESAGKRKSGRTPHGNKHVRQILCEAANCARRTKSQFSGLYQGMVIRRGHKRTIVAIGHKMLRISFALLKNGEHYRDPGIDYEKLVVQRNGPRWLQALKKFGLLQREPVTA
ncbi:MAG: IS110 family transposase [Nitrospirae bacterium]|nr:IS110 family transposase [Magnetococcales bacterium]MBF0603992.1 IS110 family transposase [Magnetococcales bacterium]HAT50363.1 IS110 family transposase [Alphaproteobacteria bacterium]